LWRKLHGGFSPGGFFSRLPTPRYLAADVSSSGRLPPTTRTTAGFFASGSLRCVERIPATIQLADQLTEEVRAFLALVTEAKVTHAVLCGFVSALRFLVQDHAQDGLGAIRATIPCP
jgi:hypothetical protein